MKSFKINTVSLETRKSLHVNLTKDTHAALKIAAFQNQLSMQEIFEEIAIHIVEENPFMVKFLQDLAARKKDRQLKKFTATDAETIYDVIAGSDPAGEKD